MHIGNMSIANQGNETKRQSSINWVTAFNILGPTKGINSSTGDFSKATGDTTGNESAFGNFPPAKYNSGSNDESYDVTQTQARDKRTSKFNLHQFQIEEESDQKESVYGQPN